MIRAAVAHRSIRGIAKPGSEQFVWDGPSTWQADHDGQGSAAHPANGGAAFSGAWQPLPGTRCRKAPPTSVLPFRLFAAPLPYRQQPLRYEQGRLGSQARNLEGN